MGWPLSGRFCLFSPGSGHPQLDRTKRTRGEKSVKGEEKLTEKEMITLLRKAKLQSSKVENGGLLEGGALKVKSEMFKNHDLV